MNGNKRQYDLICSLGGNCAAAHNLQYKGLRPFSLPFDWVYMLNEEPLYKLADCFKDDFSRFFLKENLKPLPEGSNSSHLERPQYYDTYTGYRFVNHFDLPIEEGGYSPVKEKLNRRIARLYEYIQKGNLFLFILSLSFEMNIEPILNLQKTLKEKWPNKQFDFEIIMFDCKQEKTETMPSITIHRYIRKMDDNDFNKTNHEWNFLNQCLLNKKLYPRNYKILKKLAVFFIPYKPLRQKLRRKYHV
ncbi:MAG: DUF1796 family putative cysteine peptidase [Alphaproteobacteria bacterium]